HWYPSVALEIRIQGRLKTRFPSFQTTLYIAPQKEMLNNTSLSAYHAQVGGLRFTVSDCVG
ncbi:hypothetical protein, partial [Neisseria mucosa]|uniref:hypothetical protein n=1 Tax=Neisseria mucosa TaxID=488 RepID=UPI001981B9A0